MAVRGKPLDVTTIRAILRLVGMLSIRKTALEVKVSPTTVHKYRKKSL